MTEDHVRAVGAPQVGEIAACAHEIWRVEGRPEGRAQEHWAQAEEQLWACRAHEGWTSSKD